MIEKPSTNYNEIIRVLNNLKEKGDFIGFLLIDRNGEIISENVSVNMDSKKFASMCASVLESALGLGQTVGSQKINKIIAELDEKTVLIIQMNDNKNFISFILGDESNFSFFEQLESYL
ncbi:MAG: roadblock/LC7 domain-containing protein [Promethearchaeota archaeon]